VKLSLVYPVSFLLKLIFFFFYSLVLAAQENPLPDIDSRLEKVIRINRLKALKKAHQAPRELSRLGSMLFHEVELSGTRDINCASCHHPRFGTADAQAFSIGQGGSGLGTSRIQRSGGLTRRHSPHLLNLGYPEITHMFWDGRVARNPQTGAFTTPEPALNGANPTRADITSVLKSSLSAQTIFPIANALEMRGEFGNDVADAQGNLGAWDAVMKRLLFGPKGNEYLEQFRKAYPKNSRPGVFNIGHVGEALGSFLRTAFNVIDTPYDRYLNGDKTAMTNSEKKGLEVFAGRGKCIKCHNGDHLSNFEFKTVGTPQLTPAEYPAPFDRGRFEVTQKKSDLFKFKTPALRNLSITAPYMHNGVFNSLEKVIEHYDNPKESLASFSLSNASIDLSNYSSSFVIDRDETRNKLRINLISIGDVRRGLNLTPSEKADLLSFLKTGLLDYRFQGNR